MLMFNCSYYIRDHCLYSMGYSRVGDIARPVTPGTAMTGIWTIWRKQFKGCRDPTHTLLFLGAIRNAYQR